MKIFKISEDTDFKSLCAKIAPHKSGEKIMEKKSKLNYFYIKELSSSAANILKQDALSIGAELVSNKAVINKNILSQALLIANDKQKSLLIKKEKKQDFGLKNLASFLEKDFKKPKKIKIMSVININKDSFYAKSRKSEKDFLDTVYKHIELKADYIDIGAISTRPGSFYPGIDEELARLDFAFKLIKEHKLCLKASFSLDSFSFKAQKKALDLGFALINDISALKDESLLDLALSYEVPYILMHMQKEPHNMQKNIKYDDFLHELSSFFEEKLKIIKKKGLKKVIIDPGFGFAKNLEHNLLLIKQLEHLLQFSCPILVGASRKSSISTLYKSEAKDRLAGSLAFHAAAVKNGASIIRTHDLYEHKQYFAVYEALQKCSI